MCQESETFSYPGESGTLARVAGCRVTESGSRAFLRYIKTVPCVAAAATVAGDRGAERREREERKAPRRREANGANDDVIADVIIRDAVHTTAKPAADRWTRPECERTYWPTRLMMPLQ